MYNFSLVKKDGEHVKVWGYGINKITDPTASTDLSEIRSVIPHVPDEIFKPPDEKPLDILVGTNFFGLHPAGGTGKNQMDNLKVLNSEFGSGWIIGGSHPKLKPAKVFLGT